MEVKEWRDSHTWDAFIASQPESQFLQSWAWGEFQRSVGRTVVRLGLEHESRLVGTAQLILQRHPLTIRSANLYRGPVIDLSLSPEDFYLAHQALLNELRARARAYGASYIHLEPSWTQQSPAAQLAQQHGWRTGPSSQPRHSLLLKLQKGETDILAAMHEKTRYNIRLAERKGVIVKQSSDDEAVNHFLRLNRITASRQNIRPHGDGYYRKMVKTLVPAGVMTLFHAKKDQTTLAANIVLRCGDTVTYVHGASGNEQREVMAPQLLQWRQIQWAKQEGAYWYDFWGIQPPTTGAEHAWAGITRFKKGFGGEERRYVSAVEQPLSGWRYLLLRWRRTLRG